MGNIIDLDTKKQEKSFDYREKLLEDDTELNRFIETHSLTAEQTSAYQTYQNKVREYERVDREYNLKDSNLHFNEDSAMTYLQKYRNVERELFSLRAELVDLLLG